MSPPTGVVLRILCPLLVVLLASLACSGLATHHVVDPLDKRALITPGELEPWFDAPLDAGSLVYEKEQVIGGSWAFEMDHSSGDVTFTSIARIDPTAEAAQQTFSIQAAVTASMVTLEDDELCTSGDQRRCGRYAPDGVVCHVRQGRVAIWLMTESERLREPGACDQLLAPALARLAAHKPAQAPKP